MAAEFTEDDRALLERAVTLAHRAVDDGARPFAAVLARDGAVIAEGRNEVAATGDPTRHAELALISRVAPGLSADVLAASTLYTSTEPCEMCAGATVRAGIGRVVFACTDATAAEVAARPPTLRAIDVIAGMAADVELIGPLLPEAGRAVHEAFRDRGSSGA